MSNSGENRVGIAEIQELFSNGTIKSPEDLITHGLAATEEGAKSIFEAYQQVPLNKVPVQATLENNVVIEESDDFEIKTISPSKEIYQTIQIPVRADLMNADDVDTESFLEKLLQHEVADVRKKFRLFGQQEIHYANGTIKPLDSQIHYRFQDRSILVEKEFFEEFLKEDGNIEKLFLENKSFDIELPEINTQVKQESCEAAKNLIEQEVVEQKPIEVKKVHNYKGAIKTGLAVGLGLVAGAFGLNHIMQPKPIKSFLEFHLGESQSVYELNKSLKDYFRNPNRSDNLLKLLSIKGMEVKEYPNFEDKYKIEKEEAIRNDLNTLKEIESGENQETFEVALPNTITLSYWGVDHEIQLKFDNTYKTIQDQMDEELKAIKTLYSYATVKSDLTVETLNYFKSLNMQDIFQINDPSIMDNIERLKQRHGVAREMHPFLPYISNLDKMKLAIVKNTLSSFKAFQSTYNNKEVTDFNLDIANRVAKAELSKDHHHALVKKSITGTNVLAYMKDKKDPKYEGIAKWADQEIRGALNTTFKPYFVKSLQSVSDVLEDPSILQKGAKIHNNIKLDRHTGKVMEDFVSKVEDYLKPN